jgi:glucuronate isomerase
MSATEYIHEDFLLETESARRLYREYAEGLPIIDYHCHLSPEEIAEDRRWENLTQVWLCGDHYKWRAMRSNGVEERFCTGDASDREKFGKWAETVPWLVRNQLYPWTHLELARYFGIDDVLLGPRTARAVWEKANAVIAEDWFSARGIMKKSDVRLVCTTDDPTDTLEHHRKIAQDDSFDVKVLPAWRPDKGMAVEHPDAFNAWVDELAEAADVDVRDFASYMDALRKRHAFFHEAGCRLSDHGVEVIHAEDCTEAEAAAIFSKVRGGKDLGPGEVVRFKSAMLHEFAVMDCERGWTQQFHYGVLRNCNSRLFEKLGPDIGCDSIGDFEVGRAMVRFFDRLDSEAKLARTILYNVNPRDNALLAAMTGNFPEAREPGKMQFGSAWWFLDTREGMERQMVDLSQTGLLSRFVGMLTDSRSFLSYPRHEFFRRVLANLLGGDMEKGCIPRDFELVGRMVRDISYNNAARYFRFGVAER